MMLQFGETSKLIGTRDHRDAFSSHRAGCAHLLRVGSLAWWIRRGLFLQTVPKSAIEISMIHQTKKLKGEPTAEKESAISVGVKVVVG
jgi:hypothetical protein